MNMGKIKTKKAEKKSKVVAIFVLFLLPFVHVILSGLWAMKGNYIYAGMSALFSIIWSIVFSAVLISFIIRCEIEEVKTLICEYFNKDSAVAQKAT